MHCMPPLTMHMLHATPPPSPLQVVVLSGSRYGKASGSLNGGGEARVGAYNAVMYR